MSLLINEENSFLVLSHEDYIKSIYREVDGVSYRFRKDLFAIDIPFKTYDNGSTKAKKRRKFLEHTNVNLSDCYNYPVKVYKQHEEAIKSYFAQFASKSESNNQSLANINAKCSMRNKQVLNTVSQLQELSAKEGMLTWDKFYGSNTYNYAILGQFNNHNFLVPSNCQFFNMDVLDMACNWKRPNEKYDVIVMDPPWMNKAIRRKNKKQLPNGSNDGYSFMQNEDIARIPVDEWLSEDGVVFVWCTNAAKHHSAVERCFAQWNVELVAVWYWLKVTTQGDPIIPFASRDSNMKQPYEVIVVGARSCLATRWRPQKERLLISVPSAVHSHKPPLTEVIRQCLQDVFTIDWEDVKRLEIFARSLLPGWTSIGNEVLKLQSVCFYESQDIYKKKQDVT